ncbi:FAD-dependent oxidoreductase [Evansella sp. LMS18]|uniref:hydroxysqualene dehydroxylase n=1 Tax=Evansella sp. LMS18 TaxID=2924033 RepID=UPI0020D0589D|nr:FAD-dependent oxidoreductase [Evansella sp. LMS18]UTR10509.1 FAD-dependent oxidoreductase [Evansella sp. LMS18]
MERDVVIVGAGLAGLTAAIELSEKGKDVLLLEKANYPGGRCGSWDDDGMAVEAGFHRHIGYYSEMPAILKRVGVKVDDIVMWENNIDIRIPEKNDTAVIGIAPCYAPLQFLRGIFGNNHIFSLKDKLSLIPFLAAGFIEYAVKRGSLDKYSVTEFAEKYGVTKNAQTYLLKPLSTGLFFLQPEQYSAKVFFGLFAPAIPKVFRMRIGAYLGGMTELFSRPLAKGVEERGGEVRFGQDVSGLIGNGGQIRGVVLKSGEEIYAKNVIVATNIVQAKQLLRTCVADHKWFQPFFRLPTMSAVTIQFDLTEPCYPYDRTTFGPTTVLASFAEQSRSTFKHVPGRLSVILAHPEKFIDMHEEEIMNIVTDDARKLGIHLEGNISNYRVIRHKEKYYHLGPGHDRLRPPQRTPVKGLALAGDYTKQHYFGTMEGAVISGRRAAAAVMRS